jgi:subtilisin family serine protease
MSAITALLKQITADRNFTYAELEQLRPALEALPSHASPEARELLDVWADGANRFDSEALRAVMTELRNRFGYALPGGNGRPPSPESGPNAVRGNVSETDLRFHALLERVGRSDASTTVGVLDTGLDVAHAALEDKLWLNAGEIAGNQIDDDGNGLIDDLRGWDFTDHDADLTSHPGKVFFQHGTHVSGLASRGSIHLDVVHAKMMAAGKEADVGAAVEYAIANGARVVNMSFSMDGLTEEIRKLVDLMANHPETLFVLAAGNNGRELGQGSQTPDRILAANVLPNLVTVASSELNDSKSIFSSYSKDHVTLAAHGGGVLSTVPGDRFNSISGTSMSAPNVSAAAAKCLAIDPTISPRMLKRLLSDTVTPVAVWQTRVVSGGVLDATRAQNLAALRVLVRGGETPDAAADRVGLTDPERARLLSLLPAYLEDDVVAPITGLKSEPIRVQATPA